MSVEVLRKLGANSSKSEERGLAEMRRTDLMVFSPGMSTAGSAEIRMVMGELGRKIIATTIDERGMEYAREVIREMGFSSQIEIRLEDLRDEWNYPDGCFDFIYARLVLHYLAEKDLDKVLSGFEKSLKHGGRTFIVVRSIKNVDESDPGYSYDPITKLTTISYPRADGTREVGDPRYFHTVETIRQHLDLAGLQIVRLEEYGEQLYKDFMRTQLSPIFDQVIEVVASKR